MNKIYLIGQDHYVENDTVAWKFKVLADNDKVYEIVIKSIPTEIYEKNPILAFEILHEFCKSFEWKKYE